MASAAAPEPPPISTDPPGPGFSITTTRPDRLLRHDISDEELDMLCQTRSDGASEGLWVAVGAVIGGIPSVIPAAATYWGSEDHSMPISDLLQIVVFAVALVVTGVLWLVVNKRGKTGTDLKVQIRNRTTRLTT